MSAPIKLTPDTEKKLLNHIRMGLTIVNSCQLSDISKSTYYSWIDRAKNGEEPYSGFLDKLKKAEAEAKAKLIKDIQVDPSWQSKAWILERRWSSEWGKKERHAIEGDVNLTLEYTIRKK